MKLFLINFETSDATTNIAWVKADDAATALDRLEDCLFYGGCNTITEVTTGVRDIPEFPEPKYLLKPKRGISRFFKVDANSKGIGYTEGA